jgi:hypothetical protein
VLDATQSTQTLDWMLTYSHNINFSTQLKNFTPKDWILQREVEESSRGCWNAIQMIKNQQSKRDGVETLFKGPEKATRGGE